MRLKFPFPSWASCTILLALCAFLLIPALSRFSQPFLQADEDSSLLFYASFDKNFVADLAFGEDTPLIAQSSRIVRDGRRDRGAYLENDALVSYDAPGNVYAERGTIGFWWKLDEPLGTTPFSIVRVSFAQQVSWDYAFVELNWTGENIEFKLRDQDGHLYQISTENKTVLVAGRWFYFAVTWDELDGLALYVDGLQVGTVRKELHLEAALDQIGIHAKQSSPQKMLGNERRVWIDEFRIYSSALNATQIQNLIQLGSGRAGSMPSSASLNPELWNRHWMSRFGWQDPNSLPRVSSSTFIRKLLLNEARDSGKLIGAVNDGKSETGWPLKGFEATEAGKLLEFGLSAQPWNLLQVQGSFRGQIFQESQGQKRLLLEDSDSRPRCFQKILNTPISPSSLFIQREDGLLREMSLYSIQNGTSNHSTSDKPSESSSESKVAFRLLQADQAGKLAGVSRTQMVNLFGEKTSLIRRYLPGDRSAWVGIPPEIFPTGPPAPAEHPEQLHYYHVILPPFLSHTPFDALRFQFTPSTLGGQPESMVNLQIKDPVFPGRNLADVHFRLSNSSPTDLVIDIPDTVVPINAPLWLTFASDSKDFGSSFLTGTRVEIWTSQSEQGTLTDRGKTEFFADRFAWIRQCFQTFSAYNSWTTIDYSKLRRQLKGIDELFRVIEDVVHVDPKEPTALAYLTWLNPSLSPPEFKQPAVPSPDVPLWAFQQRLLVQSFKDLVDWWMKKRQLPTGEWGDGLSQDTNLLTNWAGVALLDSSAGPAKKALLSTAEACYRMGLLKDGLGATLSDPAQQYRQGLNLLCAAAILDYGNPIWLERLMETVRQLERITGTNEAVHRHFRSYLLSATDLVEDGVFGRQDRNSALLLHPALVLAWYNANPKAIAWLREYANSLDAHWQKDAYPRDRYPKMVSGIRFFTDEVVSRGLPGPDVVNLFWGLYQLTGENKYLWLLNKLVQSGDTALAGNIAGRWLDLANQEIIGDAIMREVERSNIWDHNLQEDETGLLARQLAFELTRKKRYLEEYQAALLKHQTQNRALYTESEPATGSILLSQRALQRARLGGVAFYDHVTFPGHAISWEGAQGNLSAVVLKSTSDRLRLIAFNSGKSLLDVNMRVWGLENGTYNVIEGTDVSGDDQDDQIDVETTRRQLSLRRFSEIPISLRPLKRTVIDFKQTKKGVPIFTLPDLAIGPGDLEYDPVTDKGFLTIHNIGSASSPAFTVVIENEKRVIILKKDFPGMDAPLDLLPKRVTMEFSGVRGKGNRLLTFRVDPGNQVDELNEENNQIRKALN